MGVVNLLLNDLWFVLIAVLFTGFFFLEGFDYGVGMSTWLLARTDHQRRVLINTIGPFWDANEVWLITAAGAMFAAFPHWYSTLFSGYYVLLTLILLGLIVRGVAFDFRGKVDRPAWRKVWDTAFFVGSVVPPFLFGVMFASVLKGVPIGQDMVLNASFGDIINPYTVFSGITIAGLCFLHGLTFISLRTTGELRERSRQVGMKFLPVEALLLAVLVLWTAGATDLFAARFSLSAAVIVLGVIVVGLSWYFLRNRKEGWAFGMTGATVVLVVASLFIGLYPNTMISSLGDEFHLTVMNSASNPYTLKMMTMVVVTLLPFVLAYQAWSYYVFRQRIKRGDSLEY